MSKQPAILCLVLALAAPARATPPRPPVAKRAPKVSVLHGERRVDDYFWLREKKNPEVVAYLRAENAYTDAMMRSTQPLQGVLYKELLSHVKETDVNVPYREGRYFYYSRTEEGKQYPILCRKPGKLDAPEQVVLDLNEMSKGHEFFSLRAYRVSDDGNRLAFSTDTTGFRDYGLGLLDLRTGAALPDRIEKVDTVAWAADGTTLFYVVEDQAKRPYRLYRHRLGRSDDALVYEEKDERFRVEVSRSRSKAYLFLTSASKTTSEVRYLPARQPGAEWKLVAPRVAGQEYYIDHHGDRFFIRTNDTGRNFRLVTARVRDPARTRWTEVVPHRAEVMLEDMELFADHYVLVERREGLPQLRAVELKSGRSTEIQFPEPAYAALPEMNREWKARTFRYVYQSLVTPKSIFDYDLVRHQSKLLKETEVPGGFDRANYVSARLLAAAPDGVKVPISIVHRKSVRRDGTAPIFLVGYGAYGYPNEIMFSSNRLALLDRGVVVAVAHVRGGGELGKRWHDDGRMRHKRTTFTDFVAVAEHLLKQKIGARDRLAIGGVSAGGLLIGAVTNLRPDLFRAVVLWMPFVDVINTMMDASLPLTVTEYEEWGNPQKKADYDYIKTYSPYDNLRATRYPSMLVRTSLNDSQVMYWEPAKYVARMRALKKDANPLLLKTIMVAGHGGQSGRYDSLHDTAFDYAFLLTQLGIKK